MESAEAGQAADHARLRVLLIEDDSRDALLVEEYLKSQDDGFDVVHVTRIEQAIPFLRDPSIDAIIVDLNLPDASGVQAVVSAHAACIGQPILAMTGSGDLGTGLEAVRLGAQDFMVKDEVTAAGLCRAIRYAIERQKLIGCMRDSVHASLTDGANLRRLLFGGTEGLVVVGTDGTIRFANQTAEGLFGWSGRDHMGQPFDVTSIPGLEVEQEITRPDGSTVVAEIRSVDVLWEDEPARLVSLRDVSERRRAAERQMRLDMLTGFLGNVSHELRTPLSAIYQFVSNVSDGIVGPVTAEQRDSLRAALRNVDEVLAMIANLLDVARSQAGKLRIDPQLINLATETRHLFDVFAASARERGIAFEADVPPDLPPVLADPGRVRQVITNLVDNAIKFTPGSGSVRLEAHAAADGKRVVIRVSDTGCGVPREHLESIFEQLHQVPDVEYRTRRGLGLGLFITRELVRGMNGEIRVRSKPGKGASFDVSLPMMSWGALVEPLETVRRESCQDLVLLRISIGWTDGDPSEPIQDSPIWKLSDLLPGILGARRHAILPRTQVEERVHLGAVLLVDPGTWASVKDELETRLQAGAPACDSAMSTDIDDILLAGGQGALRGADIVSELVRFYLQPTQGAGHG